MRLILGLGGNLGDVPTLFADAARALAARFPLLAASSLWRTAPQGPPQPDFLNAAVLLEVDVHPLQVLALCRAIEAAAGRDRSREEHWGPRPLDLDLLIVPGLVIESAALRLPHRELGVRRFALLPAAEIAPDWLHPRTLQPLATLAAALDPAGQDCEAIGAFPA